MVVTISEPIFVAVGQWLVEWSSSFGADARFWIYLNGSLIESNSPTTSMIVVLDSGGLAELEVLDAAVSDDDPTYPARTRIAWYAVDGAAQYRVEEYVSGDWTERKTFRSEDADFFVFESRILEDSTSHQFRVVPIGADANEGTPLSWTILMVRRPDPPNVTFSYSSGTGEVTIASA